MAVALAGMPTMISHAEEYFDTSDSEEADNPIGTDRRRRRRIEDASDADPIVGLDGAIFIRYEDFIQEYDPEPQAATLLDDDPSGALIVAHGDVAVPEDTSSSDEEFDVASVFVPEAPCADIPAVQTEPSPARRKRPRTKKKKRLQQEGEKENDASRAGLVEMTCKLEPTDPPSFTTTLPRMPKTPLSEITVAPREEGIREQWYYPAAVDTMDESAGPRELLIGVVSDFHPIQAIEAASIDQETCIRDASLLGIEALENETAIDRVFAIAKANDVDRVGMTLHHVSVDHPKVSELDGYVDSLGKTMAAQAIESSIELADSAAFDALNAKQSQGRSEHDVLVPVQEMDGFFDRIKGDTPVLNDIEAMVKEATSADGRRKFVEQLIKREFAADRTYRRWGCAKRPISEHDQWLGSKVDAVYIDDYLRPAEPHFGERPCVRGSACFSLILPALKSFPRTMDDSTRKPGFIQREFLLPEHLTVYRGDTNDSPATRPEELGPMQRSFLDSMNDDVNGAEATRPNPTRVRRTPEERRIGGACFHCILFRQSLKCWQVGQKGTPWDLQIQYFEVETKPPHGYPADRLLPIVMPKTGVPTGIVAPALALVVDDYYLSTRTIRSLDGTFEREVPCYVQVARDF